MYVACSCGQRHWGRHGAAGLLLTDADRSGVVLQHRSLMTHHGGTWALMGGAIETGEGPAEAALREAAEEEHLDPGSVQVREVVVGTDHPEWRYSYVLAETTRPAVARLPDSGSWESQGATWVDLAAVQRQPLHPALREDWSWLVELLRRTDGPRDRSRPLRPPCSARGYGSDAGPPRHP
ncbi:MAG: NUDIX domain-containing protein [Nocardioidaceae bacterium]